MSSVTTPTTPTLSTSVIPITTIAQGASLRTVTGLDLRGKFAGLLHVRIGRGGNAALSAGMYCYVEPLIGGSPGTRVHPVQLFPTQSPDFAAATNQACAASGNTAGQNVLTMGSTTGMAAGSIICIQDSAGSPTTLTEWHRVSKVVGATTLNLCEPLQNAHVTTSHTVRNKAEVYSFQLPGDQAYALVIDYGAETTGDAITVESYVETWDSMTST